MTDARSTSPDESPRPQPPATDANATKEKPAADTQNVEAKRRPRAKIALDFDPSPAIVRRRLEGEQ